MKKLSLIIAALATLFSVSCTQEELAGPAAGQEVDVTLTAQLPGGIATKAYADGNEVNTIVYAVYNSGTTTLVHNNEVPVVSKETGRGADIHLKLVSGRTYDFVFWAEVEGNDVYELHLEDQTMEVHYENMLSNNEKTDAFYAFQSGWKIDGPQTKSVSLYRPFAQINLGTDDLTSSDDNTLNVTRSSMTARVANVLNFATGEVSGDAQVTYAVNAIPATSAEFQFPVTHSDPDNKGLKYEYLAMNYVLVGESQTTTDCEFAIYEGENENATNTVTVANVPVKRNYRTNVYGSLITDPTDVGVDIRPGINDGENKEVTELPANTPEKDFYAALQKGGSLTLTAAEGADVIKTIDFNNLTIAKDLTLTLDAPVDAIILGGNNETASASLDVESGSVKPNVTIVIAKNVKFPKFTFNGTTENYTIKGSLETNQPLTEVIETSGNVRNMAIENVKATGNAMIKGNNHTVGLTVKNCVATDLNARFVRIFELRNAKILNNTIALDASANPTGDERHAIEVYSCGDDILIEGNTITKTFKHGIFVQGVGTSALTIKNNKISGVAEDGIKIDRSHKVVVSGNVIDAADYGIRVDRFDPLKVAATADIAITDNTISIDGIDNEGNPATAIRVRYRADEYPGGVTVNLTATGNKAGANGIPAGKYTNFVSEGMTLTGDYEYPFILAGGLALSSDGKTIGVQTAEGLMSLGTVTTGAVEGNVKNVKLLADIDMTGKEWTPLGSHWVNFDGNGKMISNLNCGVDAAGKSGFIGYLGASTIKDLTLKNVTAAGEQVGIIAGNAEGGTLENVTITGTNSAIYKDVENYDESYGGVGAIFGVNTAGAERTVGVTIAEGAVITVDRTGLVTESPAGNEYAMYAGVKVTDKGTVIVKADGIELVNGNAEISNANGMRYFENAVNVGKNTFSGKTVKLVKDIDLENIAWTPVGQTGATQFQGTFDGQNYTISNLNINSLEHIGDYSSGLFGWLQGGKVLNLNVDKVKIVGHRRVGVIAGYVEDVEGVAMIDHCAVSNIEIEAIPEMRADGQYDNGDKVGGIVGYLNENSTTVSNCSVTNGTVKAYRDCGGLIGMTYPANIITGNKVSDLTVISDQSICTAAGYDDGKGTQANAGEIIGRGGESFISSNSATDVTIQVIPN